MCIRDRADNAPRKNSIGGFNALFDFQSFGKNSTLNYGFELNGISTALEFRNFVGVTFEQMENTTELAGYVSWRQKTGPLIIEPGLRAQFYASLGDFSIEPRLALKSNFSDKVRLKSVSYTHLTLPTSDLV